MILEILGRSNRPMTPTQINEELGLPKQTIHRLCTTLIKEGFLIPDSNERKLRPSRRLRMMAGGILYSSKFHIARRQIMMNLAHDVKETVNFVVPEDEGMRYIDRVETDWVFQVQLPIGTHVPFHCTASGKTFLASLPSARRRAMVESLKLDRLTSKTFTDSDGLMAELKKVARQGYAIDDEEFVEGMVAMAMPVLDENGRYLASLAFHGPIQRVTLENILELREPLANAVKQMSHTILAFED
ncbi:MAG: IclR family transcriptional regulator [Pseudomonadota bacterium]